MDSLRQWHFRVFQIMRTRDSIQFTYMQEFLLSPNLGRSSLHYSQCQRQAKQITTIAKSNQRRLKDRLFIRVSLLRVLCRGRGRTGNASSCSCCQGSAAQVRSQHPSLDGCVRFGHREELPVSSCALESTDKRVYRQGSLRREP